MPSFAQKVIHFNKHITFKDSLPTGISIMNPFQQDKNIMPLVTAFYTKYYNDNNPRRLILGINPGRFGGGITGIPFTDPKRLVSECSIPYSGKPAHEPSSVFIYKMINAFGGTEKFYSRFYISSICPLGFTSTSKKGTEVNYNYYDMPALTQAVKPFIIKTLRQQIGFGLYTDTCFCMGTGKNYKFLLHLNEEEHLFKNIIPLEHPRFIMQYKLKTLQSYINKYLAYFNDVDSPIPEISATK